MRLINTQTYELHEFPNVPEHDYAILSHTWEDEEITFGKFQDADYMRASGRNTQGWRKIKSFCDLAAENNTEWAWVDTCCIDKSSSAELSESINSMFTWYKLSKYCMVYLSDVSSDDNLSKDEVSFHNLFMKSRWFTRGWTLQELLAPREAQFYSASWEYLGTRKELSKQICEATRIPTPFIFYPQRFSPSWACIAQRMSWASYRKTTRPEDQAYSLMGLFEVNMPLMYGEGGEMAFRRLQLEIIKENDDESIFAWDHSSSHPNHSMFAKSINYFRFCGDVRLHYNSTATAHPFSATNKGLSLRKTLYPLSPENRKQVSTKDSAIVDYISGQTQDTSLSDSIRVVILACRQNGESVALVLMPSYYRSTTYLRIEKIRLLDALFSGEIRDIFINPIEVLGRKHLAKLEEDLTRDLALNYEICAASPWSERILEFSLSLSEDETEVLVNVYNQHTKSFEQEPFLSVIRQLGFPQHTVEDYKRAILKTFGDMRV